MKKSNICRCCLTGGCCKDLRNSYFYIDTLENYGEMITKIFNLTLNGQKMFICEECITKLRDAASFKQQILDIEDKLNEQSKNFIEVDNDSEAKIDDESCASSFNNEECPEIVVKKIQREKTIKKKDSISQTQKSQNKLQEGTDVYKPLNTTLKLISNSNICLFKSLRTKFACYVCKKTYFNIKDLRKHSQDHSNDEFKLRVRKLRGMTSINADITNLTCNCSEICLDLDVFIKHLTDTHEITFSNTNHLLRPYKLEDGFHCVICEESFKTFARLSIHMNCHSTRNVCEICGLAFFNRQSLLKHVRGQHSEKKCSQCSLKFSTSALLSRHLVKAHDRAPVKYYCQICGMTFPYTYRLTDHMVENHGVKRNTVDCSECGKTVKSDYYLKIHIRSVHLKERNYPCPLCDLRFFTKTDKLRHEKTHQNNTKFACNLCETKFKSKDSERRHMKRQHGGHEITKQG